MNKEELSKLAKSFGIEGRGGYGLYGYEEELLAFANACEKIGMEKAANILIDETKWHWHPRKFAEAIRGYYLTNETEPDIKST